jgi:hypothetical protein
MKSRFALPLAVVLCALPARGLSQGGDRAAVGAIYWPGWTGDSKWADNLKPPEWRNRLPFYAEFSGGKLTVRSDNQATMDREIKYAGAAGLSYFAFDYSPGDAKAGLPLYLASPFRDKINFCLLLLGSGKKGAWPEVVRSLVRLFKEPTYQKVEDGRPLVFRYYVERMAGEFGSDAAARAALDYLRSETVKAGLKPPYLVAQVWNAQVGARYADSLGFDALSAYSMSLDVNTFQRKEYPYSRLAKINRDFWNACRGKGKEVVPIVNAGWDVRPRWWDTDLMKVYNGGEQPWFAAPTPDELAQNVRDAIEWNRIHPAAGRANTVLIYAWNETDEGGWLVPTISEGTARIDAVGRVISDEGGATGRRGAAP